MRPRVLLTCALVVDASSGLACAPAIVVACRADVFGTPDCGTIDERDERDTPEMIICILQEAHAYVELFLGRRELGAVQEKKNYALHRHHQTIVSIVQLIFCTI